MHIRIRVLRFSLKLHELKVDSDKPNTSCLHISIYELTRNLLRKENTKYRESCNCNMFLIQLSIKLIE